MKCLILAAGYATRLYPLTENFPKPLLKVGDKTILDWLVDDLLRCGISEYLVVTNHRFAGHFSAWAAQKKNGIFRVVDDGTETNETRLGAVRDIQLALEGVTEPVLVIAGDNVLDFSFKGFIDYFNKKQHSCVMCYDEPSLAKRQRTAIITYDETGLIDSYEEKPQAPKSSHAVPPFYCYRPEDIARIPEALDNGCGSDAPGSLAAWLSGQVTVYAWPMPGKRYDIGNHESYREVQEQYKGITH